MADGLNAMSASQISSDLKIIESSAERCLYNQAIDTSDGYMLPAGHHEGYLLSPRASLRRLVGNLEFDICILVCAHIIPKMIIFKSYDAHVLMTM